MHLPSETFCGEEGLQRHQRSRWTMQVTCEGLGVLLVEELGVVEGVLCMEML